MKKSYIGGWVQQVAVNLSWYIVNNHISYEVLEKGTGIYRTRLSRIMNGTADLTVSELENICNFLGIKIEEVIKDGEQTSTS